MNSVNTPFKTVFICLFGRYCKGLVISCLCFFILPFYSIAQNCDYLPGSVILNNSPENNSTFYSTVYFLITANQDSIVQVNAKPEFLDLEKGYYEAYAVTYKTRDSIFNLESGNFFKDITSNCLNFSAPFALSVCSPPLLDNLEESKLEVCADINTTLTLTDSLTFKDDDGMLDTFSILITIIESPDGLNDSLDIDLSPFIGLTKSYNSSRLEIHNIRSPSQVQAILRTVYFYSSSKINGNRKIEFQVSDGVNLSNTPNREIIVSPLPMQPIQIFRKKRG